MGIFEYVAVLTSIIIGLGIAHLLQGVARMIQRQDTEPVYWVHL
jgi:predicted phage tail protein